MRRDSTVTVVQKLLKNLAFVLISIVSLMVVLSVFDVKDIELYRGMLPTVVDELIRWRKMLQKDIDSWSEGNFGIAHHLVRLYWSILSTSTIIFVRSLNTIFAGVVIHHYYKHLYGTLYMYAPAWLTELGEVTQTDFAFEDPPPELELDERLSRIPSVDEPVAVKAETQDDAQTGTRAKIRDAKPRALSIGQINAGISDPLKRFIDDPQYGVVTIECRDKWRQQEKLQKLRQTQPERSPQRPLPPVRFT